MGIDQIQRHNLQSALRELRIAKDYNDEDLEILNSLGLVLHQLGRVGEAFEIYERALELSPKNPETHNNLGILYLDKRQFKVAGKHFKKALEDPYYKTPGIAQSNLAITFYKQGKTKKGINLLREVISSEPKMCLAYKMLTDNYLEQKEFELLLTYSSLYARTCDKISDAHYKAGLALIKKGSKKAAFKHFQLCLQNSFRGALGKICKKHLQIIKSNSTILYR